MTKCAKCGVEHSRFRDASHAVPASYCCACHAMYMRTHRPRHSQLTDEQRTKANARSYANVLQRRGKLKPQPCEVCGGPAEKHHDDYSKPGVVRWVCRTHHLAEHRAAA